MHDTTRFGTYGLLFEELWEVLVSVEEFGPAVRCTFLFSSSLELRELFPSIEVSYASTEKSLSVFRSAKS